MSNKSYPRARRVGQQIQQALSELIRREVRDPRLGMVTLTEVRMSNDLSYATVFYSVLGADPEQAQDFSEKRHAFTLPQAEFEAIRSQAALLRPQALGPEDPVAGYAGEAHPIGCAADPAQPRVAGINFLNGGNWGAFVLQAGCTGMGGDAARAAMDRIFARLERASHPKAP